MTMKRLAFSRSLLLTLLSLLGIFHETDAQTDPAAKATLRKVTDTYKGYKTISAEFSLRVQQPQQSDEYTESGTIVLDIATGSYRITTSAQDIISDGKNQWTILKEEREVQITEVDPSAETITPATIFSFYEKGYKYVSANDERAGTTQLAVVELSPEDRQTPYFKIKLRINKSSNLIHDIIIFDKSGVKYMYSIKNTKSNPSLTPSSFTVKNSDYPGMEFVDLR